MNKIRLPLQTVSNPANQTYVSFRVGPNFQNISQPTSPDEKINSLILLLILRFHGNSLFPAPISGFSSTNNLWWWVKIDVKAFFHWKRSILRVLLYRGQRAWEEKGDSQRETWLLGLKLVNTNPHIDSKYCLYLNSTLTPTLQLIKICFYVPFYIFLLVKTKIHYKWKGSRKHIPSCSIKPRPFLCLVKFTLELHKFLWCIIKIRTLCSKNYDTGWFFI